MNTKKIAWTVVIAIALVIVLFDVQHNFEFSLPGETTEVDSAQEARFAECYATHDQQIHDTAFGTIDNPDVQKEFINTRRARAATECRNEYPQQLIVVSRPIRINIVEFHARYW